MASKLTKRGCRSTILRQNAGGRRPRNAIDNSQRRRDVDSTAVGTIGLGRRRRIPLHHRRRLRLGVPFYRNADSGASKAWTNMAKSST
ncbi:MAG: hypothetical protein MZU97_05045 [Bacillus subtilis]|nr:hypothetical protein [Bacillus subtilis]